MCVRREAKRRARTVFACRTKCKVRLPEQPRSQQSFQRARCAKKLTWSQSSGTEEFSRLQLHPKHCFIPPYTLSLLFHLSSSVISSLFHSLLGVCTKYKAELLWQLHNWLSVCMYWKVLDDGDGYRYPPLARTRGANEQGSAEQLKEALNGKCKTTWDAYAPLLTCLYSYLCTKQEFRRVHMDNCLLLFKTFLSLFPLFVFFSSALKVLYICHRHTGIPSDRGKTHRKKRLACELRMYVCVWWLECQRCST